jgi:hypothetical protein
MKMKFESKMKMLEYIKSLSHEDKRVIVTGYGYNPDTINSRNKVELIADYIIQGLHIGLGAKEARSYANNMSSGLIEIMPHLGKIDMEDNKLLSEVIANKVMSTKPDNVLDNASVVKPTIIKDKPSVVKPVKPTKSVKKVSIAKIKYSDYSIVFRSDRNGYEGWFGGKAEAFRPTVEKVNSFFMKKYGQNGNMIIKGE